jgi:hypothetical protein
MSLCHDFQKWTMISLASIAISLTVGLVLMQYSHGITEEQRQANREKYARLIEEDIKKQKQGKQFEIQPTDIQQKESLQALLGYCFQHADRPNPLQDLIDKGFLSPSFKGESCLSVRQMYNEVENRIREQLENQTAEQNKYNQYLVCANNQSTTYEECNHIFNGTK